MAQTQRPQSNTSSLVLDLFEKFEKTSQIVTNMEWENKPITDEYVTITTPVLLARLLERIRNAPEEIKAFHVLLSRKILY